MSQANTYFIEGAVTFTSNDKSQKADPETKTTMIRLIARPRAEEPSTNIPEYLYLERNGESELIGITDLSFCVLRFLKDRLQKYLLPSKVLSDFKLELNKVTEINQASIEALNLTYPNNCINFYLEEDDE